MPGSENLQKVQNELLRYDHPLLVFFARENKGSVEVLINLRQPIVPAPTYQFQIHPRDLDHPQFAWHFQRQLYDALHDYFIEMFTRTPQDRSSGSDTSSAEEKG